MIYPGSLITGGWQYLYAVGAMVSVIEGSRWAFLGAPAPDLASVAISAAAASALLLAGTLYFRRAESFFADIV